LQWLNLHRFTHLNDLEPQTNLGPYWVVSKQAVQYRGISRRKMNPIEHIVTNTDYTSCVSVQGATMSIRPQRYLSLASTIGARVIASCYRACNPALAPFRPALTPRRAFTGRPEDQHDPFGHPGQPQVPSRYVLSSSMTIYSKVICCE
jgi:hypothetical protein